MRAVIIEDSNGRTDAYGQLERDRFADFDALRIESLHRILDEAGRERDDLDLKIEAYRKHLCGEIRSEVPSMFAEDMYKSISDGIETVDDGAKPCRYRKGSKGDGAKFLWGNWTRMFLGENEYGTENKKVSLYKIEQFCGKDYKAISWFVIFGIGKRKFRVEAPVLGNLTPETLEHANFGKIAAFAYEDESPHYSRVHQVGQSTYRPSDIGIAIGKEIETDGGKIALC